MDLQIRKYADQNRNVVIAGLVDLQNVEVLISDTRVPGSNEGAAVYLGSLLAAVEEKNGVFLCAHIDQELVGFVVCWIEPEENPNETPDSTTYGYISDAFVFEKYRGQGIFKQLNMAAEDHLRQFPEIKRIRINVLAKNEQALRAYRSAGYSDYEVMLEKKVQ